MEEKSASGSKRAATFFAQLDVKKKIILHNTHPPQWTSSAPSGILLRRAQKATTKAKWAGGDRPPMPLLVSHQGQPGPTDPTKPRSRRKFSAPMDEILTACGKLHLASLANSTPSLNGPGAMPLVEAEPGPSKEAVSFEGHHPLIFCSSISSLAEQDYGDADTPKVVSTCDGGPMFLMPSIRDTGPGCQGEKARFERAMQRGSGYLKVPTDVPRRRHSWISG